MVEFDLDGGNSNHRVHDGLVTVIHQGKRTQYRIFFRCDATLPDNEPITQMGIAAGHNGSPWTGDILVLKRGVREEVVGLSYKDAPNVAFAVRRSVWIFFSV